MQINVKLFAVLRELAEMSELSIELPDGATVADAANQLAERFPSIKPFLHRIAFAVNQTYVKSAAHLSDGDELALIPPVSGGRA